MAARGTGHMGEEDPDHAAPQPCVTSAHGVTPNTQQAMGCQVSPTPAQSQVSLMLLMGQ